MVAPAEPPIPVLVLRATLLQRRHDFEAALADLDRVLARQPEHRQAWLSKATILALRGEPDGALAACAQVGGRLDPLIEAGCVASVARNTSGAAAAYDMLAALVRDERVERSEDHGLDPDPARRACRRSWAIRRRPRSISGPR